VTPDSAATNQVEATQVSQADVVTVHVRARPNVGAERDRSRTPAIARQAFLNGPNQSRCQTSLAESVDEQERVAATHEDAIVRIQIQRNRVQRCRRIHSKSSVSRKRRTCPSSNSWGSRVGLCPRKVEDSPIAAHRDSEAREHVRLVHRRPSTTNDNLHRFHLELGLKKLQISSAARSGL
jgi:hypothetical protein